MSNLHYVITGASRGIGLEMTRQLLAGGHAVTAVVRDPKKLPALAGELRILQADVTDAAQVEALPRQIGEKTAVDVLINNAGIYLGGAGELESLDFSEVTRMFEVNAVAPMRVTRALLPHLLQAQQAKIINITSLMGSIEDNSGGGSYGYRMSKAALNMFTRGLSRDYAGIVAAAIHPGWVKTEMGGAGAPTEVAQSAAGILRVIGTLSRKDSGSFRDYLGESLPW